MAIQGLGNKVSGASVILMVKTEAGVIPIGGQTGASINRNAETIEVTNKVSEGYKEYVGGWKDWSIDCDAFVTLGDEGQTLLEQYFAEGKSIEVSVRIGDDANVKGITYNGMALITSLSTDLAQDNAVTYSLSLQGTGALNRAVGAAATGA
ncbi:phage major tail protein, TP901-1 family [Clostridium perfringens]